MTGSTGFPIGRTSRATPRSATPTGRPCASTTSTRARATRRRSCSCTASRPGRSSTARSSPRLSRRDVAPSRPTLSASAAPASRSDYTYERHVAWMSAWAAALDLKSVTLFAQDWGGLIGLRLVAAFPDRFAAVVVSNTGLPTSQPLGEGFRAWLDFSQRVPELPIGVIVKGACLKGLTDAERTAYDAPFPDESFKAAARQFPVLVPITPEHASVAENKAAWKVLEKFEKPFVTAFSDSDPVTKGGEAIFQARVPGAKGQLHVTLHGGHFVQEDAPNEIADLIDATVRRAAI